jgi:FkbM family methyltransferase
VLDGLRTIPLRLVAAYLKATRSDFARWRLVRYALRATKKLGRQIGKKTVKTHFGFRMKVDVREFVDQHIYATGNYEDSTAQTIAGLLSPGDCCVDGGANIGFFTLLMSQRVSPGGTVLAFEPFPSTRDRLACNLALNQVTNVMVREEALSDRDGRSRFFAGQEGRSGNASLRSVDGAVQVIEVITRRLPACLPAGLRPRLIKLDVEGAELRALRGMEELLRDEHPDLVIEVSDHFLKEMGSSAVDLYQFLTQFGYAMYQIDWNGVIRHERWEPTLPQQFNALFTVRPQLPSGVPTKPV